MSILTELKTTHRALTAKIINNDIFLANALINGQQDDDKVTYIGMQQIFLKQSRQKIQRYINLLDN